MTAREMISAAHIKCTKQRVAVLEIMMSATAPMTAEQIFAKVNGMSLSTVYRILDCFCKNNIATGESIQNSSELYYALVSNRHRHFAICLGCHKMKYVDVCPVHDMSVDNFKITGHKLELYGYCDKCEKMQ